MIARDSEGRSVSLLNDEPDVQISQPANTYSPHHSFDFFYSHAVRSNTSSPATPSLTRADSYDAPISPTTPTSCHEYNCHIPYLHPLPKKDVLRRKYNEEKAQTDEDFPSYNGASKNKSTLSHDPPNHPSYEVRGAYTEPIVQDEDSCFSNRTPIERAPNRYPCRFRDSHHCTKTFTTSGHASRHSKIHTAEKGVSCSWPGCHKKFTRSDNMKQHLETHTKERIRVSRAGNSSRHRTTTSSGDVSTLTSNTTSVLMMPAGVKKPPNSKRSGKRNSLIESQIGSSPRSQSTVVSSEMKSLLNPTNIKQLQAAVSDQPAHKTTSTHYLNGLDTLALIAGARH